MFLRIERYHSFAFVVLISFAHGTFLHNREAFSLKTENKYMMSERKGRLYSYEFPQCQQCRCGVSNVNKSEGNLSRIVGGEIAQENAYPWMVLITGNNTPVCGGSLISDQYVVTAAHCTALRYRQEELKVVVGEHNYCTPDNKTTTFSIEKIIRHPLFNPKNYDYDIMLLKLSMRILFNDLVRPICLPLSALSQLGPVTVPEDEEATILGWGVRVYHSPLRSCELREAHLRIISRQKCLKKTGYTPQLLPPTLFCAGVPSGEQDSCQGDSGGPLQIKIQKDRYELIGIISTGVSCGHPRFPGIYTNVPLFTAWIIANTQDSNYCNAH